MDNNVTLDNNVNINRTFSSDSINTTNRKGFEKAKKTLEFDKILALLCECAPFSGCIERMKSLSPSVSVKNVRYMQKQTSEAKKLMETKGMPSFCGIKDISASLSRADKGASLNMPELLEIAAVLRATKNLFDYFANAEHASESVLYETAKLLSPNKFLEEKITQSILSEDIMADTASPELYDIRRKIKSASNSIRDSLQKYISGEMGTKFLQENIITTRNGRYVIPVKSEYRNEVKGLVHDTSASGATLFIEPMSVVNANNEIRMLEAKEKSEIERILYLLTSECVRFSQNLLQNYEALCVFGIVFSKAELSFRLNACEPVISDTPYIELRKARHPLLDKDTVVPIDVVLGKKYTMLVITGPNTGGKTVTLKTIGLLAIMAQCGLHIPCEDGSILPVFDSILPDIGDEQSIEQSLSTFSAHMVNIVDILKMLSKDSLILFDELGAGTDPVEGAALAEAILEKVRLTGCLCAATTHYTELKAYALTTAGVTNASCEFNIETLKPTYKLTIGLPGKSNAFAIATRLGLPSEIVHLASENVAGESRRFESLIAQLEDSRSHLESEKTKVSALRKELEEMNRKTAQERESFNKKIEMEAEKAEKKSRSLIESARASAEYIFAELDKAKKSKDEKDFAERLQKAKDNVRQSLKEASSKYGNLPEKIEEEYIPPREFRVGDSVLLRDVNKNGVILKLDGENATVQAGIIKTKTKTSNLKLIENKATVEKNVRLTKTPKTSASISAELDVRGMIGDDAWLAVDKYLDEAVMASLQQVTIIHGKGTGALRAALHTYMRNDKRIESFRQGTFGEGDSGVTVVKLK